MTSLAYALARAELIRVLTAYSGITTADGDVDGEGHGTTLFDINLKDNPAISASAIPEKTILIMSGAAAQEDKGAFSFVNATGEITLQGTGFSTQIKAGTIYRILNISSTEMDVARIESKIDALMGATGLFHEQADTLVNINAVDTGETDVLHLSAANTRYIVRSLRLKCATPGANTVTVRLYELVNDILTEVHSFAITAANFATYFSLMDMFGLPHLAGDELQVTVRASAGAYAVVGQFSHAKTNV